MNRSSSFSPSSFRASEQAPLCLSRETYNDVEHLMLEGRPQFSFANQMAEVIETSPSAILVTANSAVPIADSVRGFYEGLGMESPLIGYIRVARRQRGLDRIGIGQRLERLRLTRELSGHMDNVAVIDEFVFSGKTLKRAQELLVQLGCAKTQPIMGRWYGQALRKDVDLDRVTSTHATKMRAIGILAAHSV